MARLSFAERYRSDTRFARAVDEWVHMAVLEQIGVDPEALCGFWDGEKINVTPRQYVQGEMYVTPEDDAPTARVFVESPICDMKTPEAQAAIKAFQDAGDSEMLQAVFDYEDRSSLAVRAARAIFDLRRGEPGAGHEHAATSDEQDVLDY